MTREEKAFESVALFNKLTPDEHREMIQLARAFLARHQGSATPEQLNLIAQAKAEVPQYRHEQFTAANWTRGKDFN